MFFLDISTRACCNGVVIRRCAPGAPPPRSKTGELSVITHIAVSQSALDMLMKVGSPASHLSVSQGRRLYLFA